MAQTDIIPILEHAIGLMASDIHLLGGHPPMARVAGEILPFEDFGIFSPEDIKEMIYKILNDKQKKEFEDTLELDSSFHIPGISRFRLNVHMHMDGVGAALRVIPSEIPTPDDIGLSPILTDLTKLERGLILITGPTGSGKSTTLACLIELINQRSRRHIITIEDPIEFIYERDQCLITQRELGNQTHSFSNALKSALRQDPDIILVGEMRDLETIALALTAAETGHLVFSTLHTNDAPQSIDRIVDVFPPYQQEQIRVQLASELKAVISQILLPRADGLGRIAAREILIANQAITAIIRDGKTHQLYSAIETGASLGMIPMDRSLARLVKEGLISFADGLSKAHDPGQFQAYVK